MGWTLRLALVALLFGTGSCRPAVKPSRADLSVAYNRMQGQEDASVAGRLEPYRRTLKEKMSVKIAVAAGDFTIARPEGSLNNLMADIMRRWGAHVARQRVHIGLMNYGGIRTQWRAGDLTVGDAYEIMPFDNRLVLIQLTGTMVKGMADELAAKGGEATSGIRYAITPEGKAADILVSNYPLSADSLYWVACSDYIADNPDYIQSILKPVKRIDLNLMLRDAIIDYLRSKETVEPIVDGRVRKL